MNNHSDIMLPQSNIDSIYELTFPCFVGVVPKNSTRVTYIPGLHEYQGFADTTEFCVETFKCGKDYYLFDIISSRDWLTKKNEVEYFKRRRHLRKYLNDNWVSSIKELKMVECFTPIDYKDKIKTLNNPTNSTEYLVMSSYGYYLFEESSDGELVWLK